MLLCVNDCMKTGKVYRNLVVVEQKMYSYLTRFKNVSFHVKIFYALRQRGPHHVVCLRAPTILDPPLTIDIYFIPYS